MITHRKLAALLIALPLALNAGIAQAGDWSYYSDDYDDGYYSHYDPHYSDYYDPYYHGSRRDVGGALALGVIGGMALSAIATTKASRQVIVREDPDCYRTWRKVWNDYSGTYRSKRVLICD